MVRGCLSVNLSSLPDLVSTQSNVQWRLATAKALDVLCGGGWLAMYGTCMQPSIYAYTVQTGYLPHITMVEAIRWVLVLVPAYNQYLSR